MAKGEFVLNIGDDNVVLTRITEGKVANAWLGSPDPALAHEELAEALAEDTSARISVLFDTLDQSFKEEEIPRVSILDRRKVLARHINMAFPGANLRGARLAEQTDRKTLIYEMGSIPLDGRTPGWIDFIQSLPNERGGFYTIAAENVDIARALAPSDATPPESGNHWRHFIGVNVTGGLRQIIEKNGRLCLTRLTQAPPPDTPPDEFADMIVRDFKATITYIRRLGYQVGEVLDLTVLTTAENKRHLEEMTWDDARSASIYTPYQAGALLGLGSLGKEDQAYCDVLHAAWFASKGKGRLPLTRSAALGGVKDDLRELAYFAAPYAAGVAVAATIGWAGWTGYQLYDYSTRNQGLQLQLAQVQSNLARNQAEAGALPYTAAQVRNVITVAEALDAGKMDIVPILEGIAGALENDAVVMNIDLSNGAVMSSAAGSGQNGPAAPMLSVDIEMQLADVIATAEEAVQTAQRLEQRLVAGFGAPYVVTMTREPVGAQASEELAGGLGRAEVVVDDFSRERFAVAFRIERAR